MNNRVVLITGAKGGLGTFITQKFLSEGATVLGASRHISQQDFPAPNFTALAVDFSNPASTTARVLTGTIRSVRTSSGRLDR